MQTENIFYARCGFRQVAESGIREGVTWIRLSITGNIPREKQEKRGQIYFATEIVFIFHKYYLAVVSTLNDMMWTVG